MALRRITRDRPLTDEEAAKYRKIREQVAEEFSDLISRATPRDVSTKKAAEPRES